ncbi:hypothetical protein CALCODRAFT_555945 [Calocera cornea HHB12733]|uniref:Cep57 centrosome microtubule-binding domain-containing protein n=1 Tax=Calocera cornea HHB12733 TaxID=1353952 RepID=A0A165F773_9BASI|nr:hypothetical protein CALCODRAFT_555945 [Calocera cornea HHB12733]
MSTRDAHRPNPLDDYVRRPPIARSTSEHERMMVEHTLESHLDVVYEPSPAGTDDDVSVEYGRTGALSPVQHEASFISFSAQAPPHNAADYNHMIHNRYQSAGLDDSLGLSGLDISKSSAGHHISNVTLRAGFGGKASSPTASNIAFEPSRDVEDIKKGGHIWARNGREIHDDTPRAARTGRIRLADALGPDFSPKRAAGDVPRKRPLAASSPKFSAPETAGQRENRAARPSSPNVFSSHDSVDEGTSSGFSHQARKLRRDMALAQGVSVAPSKPPTRATGHAKGDSIQLPDLTGLTSAVVTPAKPQVSHHQPYAHSPMEKEVSAERRRHREAEQRMSAHRSDLDRITSQLLEKEEQIAELQDQLRAERALIDPRGNDGTNRIPDLERQIERLTKDNKGLRSSLESLRVELARAEETLRKQGFMLEDLRSEKQRDEDRLRETKRAYDRTFQDLRRKREEVERLQRDVARLRTHYDSMKAQWDRHLAEQLRRDVELVEHDGYEHSELSDDVEDPYVQQEPAWHTERKQLSAVAEEEEDEIQEDRHAAANVDRGMPDLSGGSVSSFGTPVEPPEPDSPRFNESFHNTSIVSDLAGPSQLRRKPFIPAGDVSAIGDEIVERRSIRSSESVRNSPADPGQLELPQPSRQRPSSAPPLPTSRSTASRHPHRAPSAASVHGVPESRAQDAPVPRPCLSDERVERLFHAPGVHDEIHCKRCRHPRNESGTGRSSPCAVNIAGLVNLIGKGKEANAAVIHRAVDEEQRRRALTELGGVNGSPSQELLTSAITELEGDFAHYRSVYEELAEQYGVIAAKSRMRRNILAEHLVEVIRILEKKVGKKQKQGKSWAR